METLLEQSKCHKSNRKKGEKMPTFFPTEISGVKRAIAVCAECPVREACLEYALENKIEHGVWGGKSERARATLVRERAKGLATV